MIFACYTKILERLELETSVATLAAERRLNLYGTISNAAAAFLEMLSHLWTARRSRRFGHELKLQISPSKLGTVQGSSLYAINFEIRIF